ncbi:carbonic anhydrase [Cyanobacterium aponinum UTEX 3222]|uniref:carbonic anhydrase n=1 Tax=Cyanobacterium aponinum TaxID=379064 RepID=UPI002B4C1CE0|nr:carbonic anhydrase [Cyanobacterium aponinum]WRL37494.1 carbonic anhydrase [Cyanobacterium aponinum UTEX 3221]WRL43853.1 carbonic anhydrase [Cyanobacterium aponinum UTEX 3222]
MNNCHCQRRNFLKMLLTGGFSLSYWLSSSSKAEANHQAKALVLTCIDFRFVDFEQNFLKNNQLDHQFDWLSLAGASLALANFPTQADTQVFWEQLDLSYRLHNIQKVIILDHQDCGAYASKFNQDFNDNLEKEIALHRQYLTQADKQIKQRYQNLDIQLYFVDLNGNVKEIS